MPQQCQQKVAFCEDAFNAQSVMEMIIFRPLPLELPFILLLVSSSHSVPRAVDGHLESPVYLLGRILPIVPLINQLTESRRREQAAQKMLKRG